MKPKSQDRVMQARITERLVSEILNTEEHFSKKIIQKRENA